MAEAKLDLPDADGSASSRADGKPAWLRRTWLTPAGFTAAGILLFFAYLAQARTVPAMSDGASQALQAWDMLHGNVLLRGWSMSDVSFYTTEVPEYLLIELVRGLTADVVHVAAALTYTLVVLLSALLAKGHATGRAALVRVLVTAGILLAPPLGYASTTGVLLSNPDHTGTQVPLLLIWLALDRARPRWWVPVVVAVMLTWVQVADTTALFEGALPLVVVCAVRMLRRRGPLAGHWYELSLAAGAIASAGAATLVLMLIRQAGGFAVTAPSTAFATPAELSARMGQKLATIMELFGANFAGLHGSHAVIPAVHVVGLALAISAVAYAVRQFLVTDDLVVQTLTAAFIVILAAYLLGYRVGAWEAVGLLPTSAVLAGRLLADRLIRVPLRLIRVPLLVSLAAVLACYGAFLIYNVSQPAASGQHPRVAAWLEAHHLNYGLAAYWKANSITLYGGNRVEVRPLKISRGRLVLLHWETDASWYDASRHDARFVILGQKSRSTASSMKTLRRAYGRPARTYRVDGFLILVWNKNLLAGPLVPGPPVGRNILAAAQRPG